MKLRTNKISKTALVIGLVLGGGSLIWGVYCLIKLIG